MDDKYLTRIGLNANLDDELALVVSAFGLGVYTRYQTITVGYEDYNLELRTSTGNYFVKIFAATRSDEDVERYVGVIEEVVRQGVRHPALMKQADGAHLLRTPQGLRLVVMQWLVGTSFWDLNRGPTKSERTELIAAASQINTSAFQPAFTYDSWSVNNFGEEFRKHADSIPAGDRPLVKKTLDEFQAIDHTSLPHALVHGDLISTNVIRADEGLYLVDFSVANYLPRIQELAVLLTDLLFEPRDEEASYNLYRESIAEYSKHIDLTDAELKALPVYIKAAHCMHIIPPAKFIASGEDNQENRHWLERGQRGIRLGFY